MSTEHGAVVNRAYSRLDIKSIDDDARMIEGIATTPSTDRQGDVVEPKGAEFTLPIPFLWHHDSKQPIGHITAAKVTPNGIQIKAQFATITEPGRLKDRLDEAWQSVKLKLVRGLSIGFSPIEAEPIKGSFGLRFLKWNWLELSAVTIPANSEANILTIKQFDTGLAANGTEAEIESPRRQSSAGVSASQGRVVKLMAPQDTRKPMPKPISERIKSLEATRQAKSAERAAIMEKTGDEGLTLDAEQAGQYDDLTAQLKSLDADLVRWRDLEEESKSQAKEVKGDSKEQGSESRAGRPVVTVKDTMPADMAFGAMILCKAHSYLEFQKGNFVTPLEVAKARYPSNNLVQGYFEKANVAGGTTTDSNFAAALLAPAQVLDSAFLEFLRPKTLVDRFGTTQNGVSIPSLKRVPFNVKVQSQTSGASANWTGEGKGKPVTKFNTTSATLLFTKIAAISVITQELARFSRPGAEGLVRDELAKAVIAKADTSFIDPALAEVSGVNPASITYGLTALTSAGATAANVLTDVQALVVQFLLAGYDVSQLVLLMPNTLALTLSLMQNSLGQESFKGMTVTGGSLAGIPVLASQYLASGASFGNMVVAVSAENIALADDGNVTIDVSREASIEMSDAPANEVVTPTQSAYSVNMFQANSLAIRAEREISWKKLRSNAVVYMDDVNWGSVGSPY